MTRLSPAQRARAAAPKTKTKARTKQKVNLTRSASGIRSAAAAATRAFFDRVFKAQSMHFYRLAGVTLFLVAFGLIMVLSASSIDALVATRNSFSVAGKQFIFAGIGFVLMSVISLMPTEFIRSKATQVLGLTVIGQLLVFVIGKEINGNRNWISVFGLFTIQPSEFLKFGVIVYLATYLSGHARRLDESSIWMRAILVCTVAMGLVMLGKDLGTVLVMTVTFLGAMALAGLPGAMLTRVLMVLAVGIPLAIFSSASRLGRIMAWINPSAPDPIGYNWQSEHGMWALSAGQIFGSGLGESKMKWSWIPEVENDFIFAIIGEELGLIGALVVIALFLALAFSFLKILQRTTDFFSRIIVQAIMLWIVFQALINIAVVLRLLPVLGVPLPLISAGGSSLIATLMAIGIVLAIERENHASGAGTRVRRAR
jgi:cell division protein FtsW